MNDVAIRMENVSKQYRLGTINHRTLVKDFQSWWARVRGMDDPNALISDTALLSTRDDLFWALQDVSLDIHEGDVVGIIGRNGAGKSTLLKILSRVTTPTSGEIKLRGRIASLLEVGTGFHPELTGRENVYLNGAILGMTKGDVMRKFEEIVAFADLNKFIDTPVKRYSSGMYVRLAFAVAAHLEPEILIVDEVLAVGDTEFQKKCLGKMEEVGRSGRTILFVSHNLGMISKLCPKACLLSNGRLVSKGRTDAVIREYLSNSKVFSGIWLLKNAPSNGSGIFFEEILVRDCHGIVSGHIPSDGNFTVDVAVVASERVCEAQIAVRITNYDGVPVLTTANTDAAMSYIPIEKGRHRFRIEIPGNFLAPGQYTLTVASMIPGVRLFDVIRDEIVISIEDLGNHATILRDGRLGVVTPLLDWKNVD